MTENIDLALNLDASGYVQGAQQVTGATQQMATGFDGVERKSGTLGRALAVITPGRAMVAAWAAPTAAAAAFEQRLGGMQAVAKVTGQSMAGLQTAMSGLARTFPVGNKGALEVVSTLQSIGYSGKNQIGVINDLGKAYIRLGAATGQNASLIGRQMTSLNRAFGATDSNTRRFEKMSDSLTTVTAKIGGSATDILSFSKNIAPMARSAGIGQTAVMGISAAFSKMGEDGYTASNAMNKMLTDLNRSVRDGSSEMETYASIVGKTREEFEALYKSDPTKALGMLTENLGGGGKGAERNLERIGLDGVRTSRVLQGLSQQGGIRQAAETAVRGYGNGATAEASAKAMDGLTDEFEKLAAASEQVAEALGRPFLGAITKVVGVAGAPVKGAAAALDNSIVQKVLQVAIPALVGYMGLRAMGALGLGSAFGRQAINNGLVRGFGEGLREVGRAQPGYVSQARAAGTMPGGVYGRVVGGAYNVGQGFGTARMHFQALQGQMRYDRALAQGLTPSQAAAAAARNNPSIRQRVVEAARATPRTIAGTAQFAQRTYNRFMQDPARALRNPNFLERPAMSRLRPGRDEFGNATGNVGKLQDELKRINATSQPLGQRLSAMAGAMATASKQAVSSTSLMGNAANAAKNSLANLTVGIRALAATARASGIGQGIAGAAKGLMNPTTIALVGGMAAGNYLKNQGQQNTQQTRDWANASVTGTMDDYRESMGRATDATKTFADQVVAANKAMLESATTEQQGRSLSSSDERYAEDTKDKRVRTYRGGVKEVAAQISTLR